MVRKIAFATVSAALCLAQVTPALAQSVSPSEVQAPLGATGAVNVRIPLGAGARTEAPSYGLTFGMGQVTGMDANARMLTREVRVADIRFNMDGRLRTAQVASFDLANMDQERRLDGLTGGLSSTFTIIGIVVVGAGVCLLLDCLGDDDEAVPN